MCLTLLLASDAPLPAVPWSTERPAFAAVPLAARHEPLRRRFDRPHVVALWAHTGCGCGFSARLEFDEEARRASLSALAAYAADAARRGATELATLWDDAAEYERPPERRLRLSAAELAERDDWLAERSHVELSAAAGASHARSGEADDG